MQSKKHKEPKKKGSKKTLPMQGKNKNESNNRIYKPFSSLEKSKQTKINKSPFK